VTELRSGYVSSAYGKKESAPVVRCSTRVRLPAEHAVLLQPASRSNNFGKFTSEGNSDNAAQAYRYDESGRSHSMIFAKPENETWTYRGWSSDARFLYYCVEEGRLTHFTLCQGQWAHLEGGPILAHRRIIERFEWLSRDRAPQTFSTDERAQNSWSCNADEWSRSLFLSF
jgi:YD repeat-containing protein